MTARWVDERDTVTITISRELAIDFATNWHPVENGDPLIELFEVCREALKEAEHNKEIERNRRLYGQDFDPDGLC